MVKLLHAQFLLPLYHLAGFTSSLFIEACIGVPLQPFRFIFPTLGNTCALLAPLFLSSFNHSV